MASQGTKGIVGSAAIHGLLVGAVVLFSGVAGTGADKEREREGTVINIKLTGDGTQGIKGKAPGLAEGTRTGDINKSGGKVFDSAAINQAIRNAQRVREKREREYQKQQAELQRQIALERQKNQAKVANNTTKNPPKETLENYLGNKGDKGKNKPKPGLPAPANGNTGSKTPAGNPNRIAGDSIGTVGTLGGGNSGDVPGYGITGGVGQNGGGGGGKMTSKMYLDDIFDKINGALSILLSQEGSTLDPTIAGRCRLNISNNGNVSFGGWVNDPGNPLFESLLRRAIDSVGNCGSRPAGMSGSVETPVSARQHF